MNYIYLFYFVYFILVRCGLSHVKHLDINRTESQSVHMLFYATLYLAWKCGFTSPPTYIFGWFAKNKITHTFQVLIEGCKNHRSHRDSMPENVTALKIPTESASKKTSLTGK